MFVCCRGPATTTSEWGLTVMGTAGFRLAGSLPRLIVVLRIESQLCAGFLQISSTPNVTSIDLEEVCENDGNSRSTFAFGYSLHIRFLDNYISVWIHNRAYIRLQRPDQRRQRRMPIDSMSSCP